MRLTIELEFEAATKTWIAEVVEVRGALVYGDTRAEAITKAKALALEIIADQQRNGELDVDALVFDAPAA